MKKKLQKRANMVGTLLITCLLFMSASLSAQIFAPEGLNMPGTYDGFTNPPTVNSVAGIQKTNGEVLPNNDLETRIYSTQIKVASSGGDLTGGNYDWLFTSGPSTNYFANKWAGVTVAMNTVQNYTYNTGSDNEITITDGKWYTMNWRDQGYTNTDAIFMETSAAPVTISNVSGPSSNKGPGSSATITATTSSAPSDEKVYLIYSTDNFTSNFQIIDITTASGTSHSGTIPNLTADTEYNYYVITTTVSISGSNNQEYYDMRTIDIDDDSGSHYKFNVDATWTTSGNSNNWSISSAWDAGEVPVNNQPVTIQNNLILDQNATVSDITISSGNTLTSENTQGRTLTIQDGGTFTNDGTFTAKDGTISLGDGSSFTNNSTFNADSGSVSFSGAGTISGTTTFYDVDISGGVDFGSGSTVDGNLTIETGGSVENNPPTYSGNSTLIYNDNNQFYGRSTEWNATTGAGYPNNVVIQNTTTLNLGANGGTGTARQIAGNLTVETGSTLSMDENGEQMTAALTVLGDFTNEGTVKLSSSTGGDLVLQGDFDDNGTFTANDRAVFFEGGSTQNIDSNSDPLEIDVMRINKSGGEVVMNKNLLLDQTADPLQFLSAGSYLNLSSNNLTIGSDGTNSSITYNGGAFRGTSNSSMIIEGDGTLGNGLVFDSNFDDLGNLTISRANNGLVTLNSALNVANDVTIEEGTFELSAADNLDGNLVLDGGIFSSGASAGTDTGKTESLNTLDVNSNSSINLGTGSHTLTFANSSGVSWNAGTILTVNNWSGESGTTGSSSAGTINVGSGGLSSTQLDQIKFSGYPTGAVLTASGEVVPKFEVIPTTNASNLGFDNVAATSFDISWDDGDGSNRIVVLRESNEVDFVPDNGVNYAANSDFSQATDLGSGNKVVYNGNASSVSVTGLSLVTTYHVEIFEYNGSSGTESYKTPGIDGSQATTGSVYKTVSSGNVNWNDTASWQLGSIPPAGAEVEIQTNTILDVDATISDITITSGNTLTSESGEGRSLSIQNGGTFTNNGIFTANDGVVSFLGDGTILGTTDFNNVDIAGGVDFGSNNSTIDGNLTIESGGFVDTNPPSYSTNSTLIYNDDAQFYGRSTEWSATTGAGYPNNVVIQNTTTLNLGANGGTGTTRQIAGNLTVKDGSTLSMDENGEEMTAALTVLGNLINEGTVELSSSSGGDFVLQGNFDDNGTFNANSRAVFFEGGNTQNINSASDPLEIDVMRIDKSAGEVVMNQNIEVAKTQNPLNFSNNTSFLNLNGNNLTIGESGINSTVTYNGGSFKGNTNSSLNIRGDGDFGDLIFEDANNNLGTLTVNRQNSGSVILPKSINISTQLNITSGSLVMNSNTVLDVSGNITNDGNITFKSELDDSTDPAKTKTAQLGAFTGNISGSGDVTVERFIPAGDNNLRAFRFLSTAVNSTGTIQDDWQEGASSNTDDPNPGFGTHITGSTTGANGFDANVSGQPSLLEFNNQTQEWNPIDNTNNTSLEAGNAYNLFVRGDRGIDLSQNSENQTPTNTTLRSTGDLVNGSLVTGTDLPALADEGEEWSYIGNPYQAIVDFTSLTIGNNVKDTFLVIWNSNASTEGIYETIDALSVTPQIIQPGQSFFVQNSTNVSAQPTITFEESDKDTSGTVTSVFSTDDIAVADLELYNNNDTRLDVMKFRFEAGADNGLDDFDAGKLSNPTENLASLNSSTLLSIERRDIPTETDTIPLSVDQYQNTDYEFQLNTSNWDDSIEVYLQDDYLDEVTLLEADATISFTVDANSPESIATDRFSLIFENTNFGIDDNELEEKISLYPNPTDGQFTIQTKGLNNNVDVRIYNMTGKQVFQKSYKESSDAEINVNAGNLTSGVYMVEMKTNIESFTTRLIIK